MSFGNLHVHSLLGSVQSVGSAGIHSCHLHRIVLIAMVLSSSSDGSSDIFMCKAPQDGELHRVAAMVPKIKSIRGANSQAENNRRHRIRTSIVSLIDWIFKNPEAAPDLWCSVSGGEFLLSSFGVAGSSREGGSVGDSSGFAKATFGKVDSDTLAKFLQTLPNGPSAALLDKIDDKDPEGIRDCFTALTQLQKSDRIPKVARESDAVATGMLRQRVEILGRLPGWFEACVDESGKLDFSKKPLYTFTYEEGRASKAHHISGRQALIDEHIRITPDYEMASPHNDMECCMVKGRDSHNLSQFFPAGSGPHQHAVCRKGQALNELAAAVKRDIDEAESQAQKTAGAGSTKFKWLLPPCSCSTRTPSRSSTSWSRRQRRGIIGTASRIEHCAVAQPVCHGFNRSYKATGFRPAFDARKQVHRS